VRRISLLPVLALLFLAGPARAADVHYLVLRGSRSASVEVTFAHPFTLMLDSYSAVPPRVTTKGSYAGVWVEQVRDDRINAGTVVVPKMRMIDGDFPVAFGIDGRLPAGRYRVHLLADGASEVRIAVRGLDRDVVLAPRGRNLVTGRLVDLALVPGAHSGSADIPVALRDTTMTVLMASTDGDVPAAESAACLTRTPTLPCGAGDSGPGVRASYLGIGGRMSTLSATFAYPHDRKPGEYDAVYDAAAAGARTAYAFALTVTP
jgi:hypothetical protein